MHCAKNAALRRAALVVLAASAIARGRDFDGREALEFTRRAVEFGPRPPGSAAIRRMQTWLVAQLKARHCEVTQDDFTASTPNGGIAMKNIIARFPGKSGRAIVLTGHYDTKLLSNFVGADDGGSSTGFLLEMAAILDGAPHKDDIYLVWFDGEEAIKDWTATDSLYGSRHLAGKWAAAGMLGRIKALINIDMIGDKELDILDEANSSAPLRTMIWAAADRTGYGKYFRRDLSSTEDDHLPFVRLGVNAADVIDLDYAPWHTPQDTMDKLSAHSFQVVGDVIMAVLMDLEEMR